MCAGIVQYNDWKSLSFEELTELNAAMNEHEKHERARLRDLIWGKK